MNAFTVTFLGHKNTKETAELNKYLEQNIHRLLARKKYVQFLVGRDSEFDRIASAAVRRVRKDYRDDNSLLTLVVPDIESKYLADVEDEKNLYNDIEVCLPASVATPKYAIHVRNRTMIDRANLVLCYLTHESPVAWKSVQYAIQQGKLVINLADAIKMEIAQKKIEAIRNKVTPSE